MQARTSSPKAPCASTWKVVLLVLCGVGVLSMHLWPTSAVGGEGRIRPVGDLSIETSATSLPATDQWHRDAGTRHHIPSKIPLVRTRIEDGKEEVGEGTSARSWPPTTATAIAQSRSHTGQTMAALDNQKPALTHDWLTDWLAVRTSLCHGKPNLTWAPRIFTAAQAELGIIAEAETEDLAMRFHNFSAREHTFRAANGRLVLYQACYKCGNDQVIDYLRKVVRHRRLLWAGGLPGGKRSQRDVAVFLDEQQRRQPAKRLQLCGLFSLRDPVEHFLSGYNEMEVRRPETRHTPEGPYSGLPLGSPGRFRQFVRDLLSGTWSQKSFYKGAPFAVADHVSLMSGMLVPLGALSEVYDMALFPCMLANLTECVPAVLRDKCGLPGPDVLDMVSGPRHASQSDPLGTHRAARAVAAESGPTLRALCALHAMDYACFSDELPVPLACQPVLARLRHHRPDSP